ncbi:MAG: hypothetical protein ABL857_06415 [Rickettsiales bacterium]
MNFSFRKKAKKENRKDGLSSSALSRSSSGEQKIIKKTFRASSGAKYSLIIGDEGAVLIYIVGKVVKSRNFIANATESNLKEFEAILSKDTKAPIFMIIDSMDQNFVQQSLPPISALGVKKLIKRRLDRDLGADVIKGYVLLERDVSGRRDWNFFMVSLENSPHLNRWFNFVENVDNRLKGIYLLSVEAENIIKNIDLAIGVPKIKKDKKNKEETGVRWKFLVTHNKVGGFRQVILRDERAIFTRLTQPVGEVTPAVVAGNIEQEITSTIEYMKRLSFDYQQGLDIYIIASSDINESLDVSRLLARNTYKFTPFEIAKLFGIDGAAQASDQFGDVIMSACIACSKVHRLVLFSPKALKVNFIYSIVKYQRAIAGLLLLVMIGYGGMIGLNLLEKYSEIENLKQKDIIQQRKLGEVKEQVEKSGKNVKKISDTVFLYKQLISESQSPLSILSRLRSAIIGAIIVRDVSWEGSDAKEQANAKAVEETISLVLVFPKAANTEKSFTSVARKVQNDVREKFPEYKVVYTKLPDVLTKKSEGGEIKFDDAVVEIDNENLEATLSLTKQIGGNPSPPNGIVNGRPVLSTDELIGLGR